MAVVGGRLAEVLGAVAAEVGERREVHAVGYLRERQAFIVEVALYDRHRVACYVDADAVTRDALDGGGEVLGRHVQPIGIVSHLALGAADAGGEELHELLDNVGRALAV